MSVKPSTHHTNGHDQQPDGIPLILDRRDPVISNAASAPKAVEFPPRQTTEFDHSDVDSVLALVAHELRTPLTVLLGQVQLLQRHLAGHADTSPRDQKAIDIIVGQARRLRMLIDTLLDVSQAKQGELRIIPAPLDFGALVRRVVEELQPALSSHALRLYTEPGQFWITGDALRLEQVLQNLLQNAVKYSPPGSVVTVQMAPYGDRVRLAVSDNGIGIPANVQPILFKRFARANHTQGQAVAGLGLGLYLCKMITDLHGGSILVESVEGRGSTFILLLPSAVR
jgi:signal transduction histidine kinase